TLPGRPRHGNAGNVSDHGRFELDSGPQEVDRAALNCGSRCNLSVLGHLTRYPPRPLRGPLAARCGRNGGGLQGEGHATRADGGGQGAAVTPLVERGGPAAVREGGEDDLFALSSAHLRAL